MATRLRSFLLLRSTLAPRPTVVFNHFNFQSGIQHNRFVRTKSAQNVPIRVTSPIQKVQLGTNDLY